MADERHQRVKELFHRARHLDRGARAAYLAQTCADDADLRREVELLLAHHREETLLVPPDSAPATDGAAGASLRRATTDEPGATSRLTAIVRVARANKRRLASGALFLVLLVAFAVWTRQRVQRSIDQLLTDHLQTVLDASVTGLRQWLAAVETDAQMWAAHPDVRTAALALARLGDRSDEPARELLESEHLDPIVSTLAGALRHPEELGVIAGNQVGRPERALLTHRRFDGFALASTSGRILGGHAPGNVRPEGIGEMMSARGVAILERVREGETVVAPPTYPEESRFAPDLKAPVMAVATPVRDDSGEPAALLAFFIEPSEEYAAILEAGRIGETGETYTFDERGVMLSESAFLDQLHETGLLDPEERSAVLQVHLRDPGGDLGRGHVPELAVLDRRRTRMARNAIDDRGSGVDVSGYRDYRGIEVVGAWTWVDDYGFGIATEIDRVEGHRTMAALVTSLRVLFWGVIGLVLGLLVSAVRNLGLQADVQRVRQYGDYRVVRVLGEGGIGTVFLAEHKMFARPAAVKVLRRDRLTPESEQRFQQEVQLTSQLTNPHTVEIFDFGRTTTGEFYYAMEYLPGLTLHQLVERYGAVKQERAVHIVKQICESLAEAHDLGIIHRDIKPMNILLCERGGRHDVVKVLDFGLVKDLGAPADMQVTQGEEVSGSPLYMAPERFEAPLTVDARADIWAVGCVAYYLLAGRDPFQARSVMEVWKQVVNEDPLPLRDSAPGVHPDLEAIVNRCMAKDREARPQSVHEVLGALQAVELHAWTWTEAGRWWADRADALPHPPKIVRRADPVF